MAYTHILPYSHRMVCKRWQAARILLCIIYTNRHTRSYSFMCGMHSNWCVCACVCISVWLNMMANANACALLECNAARSFPTHELGNNNTRTTAKQINQQNYVWNAHENGSCSSECVRKAQSLVACLVIIRLIFCGFHNHFECSVAVTLIDNVIFTFTTQKLIPIWTHFRTKKTIDYVRTHTLYLRM